ncbi:sigma-70 family RNA polymerase sigma factor [Lysinimonas soli]|uniref:Sigma-70 family RNA polymerase sigma factor n=1 Tax=Lysinimonas soli TaxID=1074233 RepID=A0ABW0NW17_9MICO
MSSQVSKLTTSDTELIESARSGDTGAFAELWRRHYRSAARVARQFTSSIDADDLVSEAYARIFQRVLAGGGPTGAFRPYLYTTIRNLASTWGAASRDVQVDMIDEFEDERIPDDPASWALDRTLTARAFRSLPDRWQTVLWYTEVEGMDPHEVAPLMGLTANGVAALSYRAREGLRSAWLQAHISNAGTSADCRWAMSRFGDRTRKSLTARESDRIEAHLLGCTKCQVISEEVDEVGSHLAMVMLPLLLGGVAGGAVLASLAHPAAALAAEAVPALPATVHAVVTGGALAAPALAAPVLGGLALGAASGTGALVGSLAVIAVIGGSVALGVGAAGSPVATPQPNATQAVIAAPLPSVRTTGAPALPTPTPTPGSALGGVGQTVGTTVDGVGSAVNGVLGGATGLVNNVTAPILGGVTGGAPAVTATVDLNLAGSGTPGATVSASVAGAVYTTVVASDGHWSLAISGLPQGTSSATVTQNTSLLGSLLGLLGLTPLSVNLNSLGLSLTLFDK